ncbi:MAG: WYL domain-containing protein [Lachnospiraceae bacterium]|jgi:predicted DNA-binding transcriptional regulator YafY|nr:WYL domain-containing protein [Lachnospiraceae bacterium]
MPKSEKQKLKLLYLLKILTEQTDEQHPMPMAVLREKLKAEEISAERKSLYSDLNCLMDFGVDVGFDPSKGNGGYYLASRDFELPELKLLVDAVSASRFITKSKSEQLIRKIEKLASRYEAVQLQRQIYTSGQIKNENESIYYHIDAIHTAVHENRQISFLYMEWNLLKKLVARKGGKHYRISPWSLMWNDENYYLIGYDAAAGMLKHFRVDKMGSIEMLKERREGEEIFKKCDLSAYSAKTFGMYGGEEQIVTLSFPNSLVGVVLDRFGKDVSLQKLAGERVAVHVKVMVSRQFYGWLAGIGKDVKVMAPESVREGYRGHLKEILENN